MLSKGFQHWLRGCESDCCLKCMFVWISQKQLGKRQQKSRNHIKEREEKVAELKDAMNSLKVCRMKEGICIPDSTCYIVLHNI